MLFQRGIIECSTHCTFDLFNMKREMGTAVIPSITLTIWQFILKPGLFAGIVWFKAWGGGRIRSASSPLPSQAMLGPTGDKLGGAPGELWGRRWSLCKELPLRAPQPNQLQVVVGGQGRGAGGQEGAELLGRCHRTTIGVYPCCQPQQYSR